MTDAIRIRGLVKQYGDKRAVNGIDLTVPEGSFFGLLGPNGAGKTTTIGALTGLVRPTSGSIEVFGTDVWKESAKAKSMIGVCPQEPNFDDFLGLERILAYHAGYFGYDYDESLERARELLRVFDLYDYRAKRIGTGHSRRHYAHRMLLTDKIVMGHCHQCCRVLMAGPDQVPAFAGAGRKSVVDGLPWNAIHVGDSETRERSCHQSVPADRLCL